MARARLDMAIQKEIQRLKSLGKSQRKVAMLLGIDRGTVRRHWQGEAPIWQPEIPDWAKTIDWNYVKTEIKKTSKKILYEELGETNKLPSYQAFCSYLRAHIGAAPPEATIRIERNPGDSIEVDYSGDSIQILNPSTGELYNVELFVGSLSYSGYFYAEFTMSQKLEDFITAHKNMFSYFGGSSSYIVPDNCKTAVIKADKLSPVINSTYQDMCKHYNTIVDPADPRSPRHKPNVENAVKYLQTDFLARVRNKTFTSLIELNRELRDWLAMANSKVIQGRGQSRLYFFNKEKLLLKKLPDVSYELCYFKRAKVHPDCHFQHEKNYYSVPYQYIGKELDIKFNKKMIYAYYNCERIAVHKCMRGTYHYSTNTAHYPEKKYVEFNYHLGLIKKQSAFIGENCHLLINKLIKKSNYPLKIIRKAQGILRLEKTYGKEILDYACEMALEFDVTNYDNINRFAKNYKKRNEQPLEAPHRQLDLICLQGGLSERDHRVTK